MDEVEVPAEETGAIEAAEPEIFDVSEEGQYRLDADGDPIPGAELKSGWLRQSDYTRKTQELAERRSEWEKQKQTEQQAAQQYQQQLRQHYERQYQQQMQQQQRAAPTTDPRAAIWEKAKQNGGIVTIDEAKALDQQWSTAFQQQVQQNQQMLQAMGMLNDRVNHLQGPLTELQSSRAQSQIDKRLNSFLDDNAVPQGDHRNKIASFLAEWEPTPEERMAGHDLEDTWAQVMDTFTGSTKEIELSQANAAQKNLGRAGGVTRPSNGVKPPMSVEDIVEATWKK